MPEGPEGEKWTDRSGAECARRKKDAEMWRRPEGKGWGDMTKDERAIHVGAMIATRPELWNLFPDSRRVGLAKEIAGMELSEMEDAGLGRIEQELTKDILKPLFRERVIEESEGRPSSAERSADLPRRR